jgi:hypothetical protein
MKTEIISLHTKIQFVLHKECSVLLLGKPIAECCIGNEHIHKVCWIRAECQIANLAARMRLLATRIQRATALRDTKF